MNCQRSLGEQMEQPGVKEVFLTGIYHIIYNWNSSDSFEVVTEVALGRANKGQVPTAKDKPWNRLDLRNKGEGLQSPLQMQR